MRVGFNLINSNASPRGCDRYALELVRALSASYAGDELILFHAPWQSYVMEAKAPNIGTVLVDAPRPASARSLWQTFSFPGMAQNRGVDVMHYTNPIPIGRMPMPVVVTIHDLAEFSQPRKYGWVRAAARRSIVRSAARSAARIIVVSESTRRELVKYTGAVESRIAVTPEGVCVPDDPLGEQAHAAQPALPGRYLLFVGVVERTKQVEQLVHAFSRVDPRLRAEVALVIAGRPGNGQRELENAIRGCGLQRQVRLLGYVPEQDLWRLYRNCEALVFPSLVEGFGLPVVEAMAVGAPVVAADIPVMREVAADAALLFPANGTQGLSEALAQVLGDPQLRARLAQAGLRRSAHYRWRETARLTRAVYAGLLDQRE